MHAATRLAVTTLTTMTLIGVTRTPAFAQVPAPSIYLGGYIGGNWVIDDWDIGNPPDRMIPPSSSLSLGARAGLQTYWWLALEGGIGILPFKSQDRTTDLGTNLALAYSADALFHIIDRKWTPFIDVGVGAYHTVAGDYGEDIDINLHYGLGVRGMITDTIALRGDVRHYLTDGDSLAFGANNIEFTAAIDFYLFDLTTDPEPMDPDADPDADGVKNSGDMCPEVPGEPEAKGCPDADKDGIGDPEDVCPKVIGVPERSGCPEPRRPAAAPARISAAPTNVGSSLSDRDGDGVLDAADDCPDDAGALPANGCPDRDGDGVADRDDRCPDAAGVAAAEGCTPVEVKEAFKGALEGLNFKSGSADILRATKPTLDKVINVLTSYPTMKVRIEGYTDDQGAEADNLALSQLRADTVRRYLIYRGIDGSRMTAKGFGEVSPIASNKTAEGRTLNRRIEFKIDSP